MKKSFIKFIHQPKKIIAISLIVAVPIGVWGYLNIHRIPANQPTVDNVSVPKNVSLSFVVNGKVNNVLVKAGDKVKKGQILATIDSDSSDGSLIQSWAAYEVAKANYQKVINGATGTAVDLVKATVNTTQVNLNETIKQQGVLVNNAYRTLLNSSLQAQSVSDYGAYDSPTISGTYECEKEGSYTIKTYSSSGGISINYSGIEEGTLLLTDVPRPMGNCGLLLSFEKTKQLLPGLEFNVEIPNKSSANYNSNNNAYLLALHSKEQAVVLAQASFGQAQASLNSVAANARPEDVASAQAQVESAYGLLIANPGYANTVISAPGDGTITAVNIIQGQIIKQNTSAVEFFGLIN